MFKIQHVKSPGPFLLHNSVQVLRPFIYKSYHTARENFGYISDADQAEISNKLSK